LAECENAVLNREIVSFGFYAGGLDDRAPFRVIGANLGIELLRRTADRQRAELGEPLLHGVGVQGGDEIMREFLDQFARHAGRPEQAPPHFGVVAGQRLGHARHIGQKTAPAKQ